MPGKSSDAKRPDVAAAVPAGQAAKQDWRDFLTSAERADLGGLEANAADLDKKRIAISHELLLVRNRCIQRRKLAARREARDTLTAPAASQPADGGLLA